MAGGEGQRLRPMRYQPPIHSREGSGGRAPGRSFFLKKGGLKVKVQVGAVDGMLRGLHCYISKHNSAGVCWQKVEHLGCVSCEEVKV